MWCEINLFEHPDSTYMPGERVHGIVKYVLSEETVFNGITVSLKGFGCLRMKWTDTLGGNGSERSFVDKEDYVDIDSIVRDKANKAPIPPGTYEAPFSFSLPQNIPPSFEYNGSVLINRIYCEINYYVRVKFGRPGSLTFDQQCKTTINVIATVNQNVLKCPASRMYAIEKKLEQPFWKKSTNKGVNIQCAIENPVVHPGKQLKICYVIDNGTKLDLTGVNIKLTHDFRFQRDGCPVIENKTLKFHSASPVKRNDSQSMELLMDIPRDVLTLEHSALVSRSYFINIVAALPNPHGDVVLKVPIHIVQPDLSSFAGVAQSNHMPPSYSDAMSDYSKDDFQK